MTRADILGGLLLAAFFGAALWEGSSFQYGTEFAPGPGFAPVWLSALGLAISLLIAFAAWRSARSSDGRAQVDAPTAVDAQARKAGLLRIGATLIALAAMIAAVPWIGFVPAILVFLLILTLAIQRMSLLLGVGISVGTALFVYVIFVHFLGVPIPAGPLGF